MTTELQETGAPNLVRTLEEQAAAETVTIPAQGYRRLCVVRRRACICRAAQTAHFTKREPGSLGVAMEAERMLDSVLRALDITDQRKAGEEE